MGPVSHQSWEISVIWFQAEEKRPLSLEWQLEDEPYLMERERYTQIESIQHTHTHTKNSIKFKIYIFSLNHFLTILQGILQKDPWLALAPIAFSPSKLGTYWGEVNFPQNTNTSFIQGSGMRDRRPALPCPPSFWHRGKTVTFRKYIYFYIYVYKNSSYLIRIVPHPFS